MPDDQKKTHRLHIYLIKEGVAEDVILDEEYSSKDVGIGKLFYKKSNSHSPQWMELFQRHGYDIEGIYSASASALLLVKTEGRFFALTFGHGGRHMLLPGVFEDRFGLLVTLNSVDPKSIRSVDSKTLDSEPIQVREQASKATETNRFGFNPESDLVRAITGTPASDNLGTMMVGKDALKVSVRCDLNDIKPLLKLLLKKSKEDTYKKEFGWIDQMKEIQDPDVIDRLNGTLIDEMNKENPSKLWLTVPDIIDWDDLAGFKYSRKQREELKDDLHLSEFKETIERGLTLDDLQQNKVHMYRSSIEEESDHWKVFDCVYCECADGNSTYFLSNGKWYEIDKKLVKKVDDAYKKIPKTVSGISFPDYNHNSENAYNKAISNVETMICLDGENIFYGGSYSQIEFCDVFATSKKMIHVKRYSGSNTLSHLFNQGANSAEALLDQEFRDEVNKKLPASSKIITPTEPRENYEVVFGIISKSERDLDIPFFSKLSLKHIYSRLHNLGYAVSLVKIKNVRDGD